jgi:hypothetical protein
MYSIHLLSTLALTVTRNIRCRGCIERNLLIIIAHARKREVFYWAGQLPSPSAVRGHSEIPSAR